jgi:hypothetical protein
LLNLGIRNVAFFLFPTSPAKSIDEIRSYKATVADALATLAFDVEYGKIVTLIQQAKKSEKKLNVRAVGLLYQFL